MRDLLFLVTVHDPETLEDLGGMDALGVDQARYVLTRLMREIEAREREEGKYKELEEQIEQ